MHCFQFDVNMLTCINVCVCLRCVHESSKRMCLGVRVCVLKCRICLSLSSVQVFLYRVRVCVRLFTIQICSVYCCLHLLFIYTACCLAVPHMNDERARSAYLPLPSFLLLLLLPFAVYISMMMLLPMNKVVQRTDRVLQPCATVVYFVLSFSEFCCYDQWSVCSFCALSMILNLLLNHLRQPVISVLIKAQALTRKTTNHCFLKK